MAVDFMLGHVCLWTCVDFVLVLLKLEPNRFLKDFFFICRKSLLHLSYM